MGLFPTELPANAVSRQLASSLEDMFDTEFDLTSAAQPATMSQPTTVDSGPFNITPPQSDIRYIA